MWFMNGSRRELINTEKVERFVIAEKEDAFLICASYSDDRPSRTVGRYAEESEARTALIGLLEAISKNKEFYFLDANSMAGNYDEKHSGFHGRKPKRHGGS